VIGHYCHNCGQENLEPKETVWHLVQHFFNDITHFDGKFFETVKYLLRKPGFLSLEYTRGRRMSYLNPIRMYVFTSAIFFIILFSLKRPEDMAKQTGLGNKDRGGLKGLSNLIADQARRQKNLEKEEDEDDREEIRTGMKNAAIEIAAIKKLYGDSAKATFTHDELKDILQRSYGDSLAAADISAADKKRIGYAIQNLEEHNTINFLGWHGDYKNVEEYDSSERALTPDLRDGWLKRTIMRRLILINEEYREEPRLFVEHLMENIYHSFPKILFISLPIFAMILNILYFRHKKYYYVDHGIFTIHVYCATFILLLLAVLLNQLDHLLGWRWFHVIADIAIFVDILYMLIYLYKAMRGFYQQRRAKTFLKYFITFSTISFINLILLVIFLLISVFSV
jgi:hypothetical protein